jgi:hypothetical protein
MTKLWVAETVLKTLFALLRTKAITVTDPCTAVLEPETGTPK